MSQPLFVQKKEGSNANASSLTLTPSSASTAKNMLIVGVLLNANGAQSPQSVSAITDTAGNIMQGMTDTGVPVNRWSSIGSVNQNGMTIEFWVCKGAVSITNLVIHLTGLQSIIACVLEYSSANGITFPNFQTLQPNQNKIQKQLLKETVSTFPNSGSELMIGFFVAMSDAFNTTPLIGTVRSTGSLNIPPALSYQILENGTVDSTGLLNLSAQSATLKATAPHVSASSIQCYFIMISGGLILNQPPGFSDQPDATLAAENFALGVQLAKISGNAALGMVRMEFFQGVYKHGDSVNLPVSPVDGYVYQRNELTYIWSIYSTCNTSTGWISGPDTLWYCGWNVDQLTGLVFSEERYRSIAHRGESNDGFLQVFTVAQRQRDALTAGVTPTFSEMVAATFASDLAYSTDLLIAMNNNSKFTVLGQECIFMGEFYNGQTVPAPVSPADGWVYTYGETTFVYSWRWTTVQGSYTDPAWVPNEQLGSLFASVGSTGAVTVKVGWAQNSGENYSESSAYGRISVFALCQRVPRWVVQPTDRPWNNLGGKNSGRPVLDGASLRFTSTTDYGANWTTTRIPATAGQTYILKYISGTIYANGIEVTPDGQGGPGIVSTGIGGQGVGCYTDAAGNIVGTPFTFSSGSTSLTVPATATYIQLGFNRITTDGTIGGLIVTNFDTDTGWTMSITRYVAVVANQFAEIDNTLFYPGSLLPASIGLQIFQNTQEASLSPEFFGPVVYQHGDTVPVPTSTLDGYAYKRSELTYIWEWNLMDDGGTYPHISTDHVRTPSFGANVNQSTGVVTCSVWRLAPGGPYIHFTNAGKLTVTVIGFRTSQQTAVTTPTTDNSPTDALTTTSFDNATQNWTVNGV